MQDFNSKKEQILVQEEALKETFLKDLAEDFSLYRASLEKEVSLLEHSTNGSVKEILSKDISKATQLLIEEIKNV